MKRKAEWLLLITGISLAGKASWNLLSYKIFQTHPELFTPSNVTVAKSLPFRLGELLPVRAGYSKGVEILGRLEIPRLGMSVLVVEGDDEHSLGLAAGHVPGTAGLGGAGNTVIAGHRDMTFRPLRKIRAGDRIYIRTKRSFEYIVSDVQIVNPDDVGILENRGSPMLTMVTCYPFRYAGDAPKRYIVQAKLVHRT